MAKRLQHHTCGFYCQGDRHAIELLAVPAATEGDVLTGMQAYVGLHGWQAVAARPAPEAQVADYAPRMGVSVSVFADTSVLLRARGYNGTPAVPWLVWIAPTAEAPHG